MTGMAKVGVTRYAASRGLKELEKARLVSVVRHAGRKPVVVILTAPALSAPTQPDAVNAAGTDDAVTSPDKKASDEESPLPPGELARCGE